MDAIEQLMDEHRLIERVLNGLEAWCKRKDGSREVLAGYVEVLTNFADDIHHGKEEDLLFRALEEHGFSADQGPVGVMLHEHHDLRQLIGTMRAASLTSAWAVARPEAVRAARHYVDVLRHHIEKEDRIVYPMARQALDANALAALGRECDAFGATHAERERAMRAVIDKLLA